MAAGNENSQVKERVPIGTLFAYLTVWAALSTGALFLWPDVIEVSPVTPWTFVPLLIAYHLRRGSAAAWAWGLAFHLSVSVGASSLAIAHRVLNEADPVLLGYAAGSWFVSAIIYASRPRPSVPLTSGWVVFLALVILLSGWTGFRPARDAQAEFARKELLAPGRWIFSESPPDPPDLSFFARGEPTLIASGERRGVQWAIYTYRAKDSEGRCLGLAEDGRYLGGSCEFDLGGPDLLTNQHHAEGKSGSAAYGMVSRRVGGLELWFEDGRTQSVPIVVPPASAGLDVNFYVALVPEGVGAEDYEIAAFDTEGRRIDGSAYLGSIRRRVSTLAPLARR